MTNPNYTVHPLDIKHSDGTRAVCEGITIREYFAILALQGLLSNSIMSQGYTDPSSKAGEAIEYADALIEQLNKTK